MKLYLNISILFCIWFLAIITIFYCGFSVLPHSGLFSDNFWTAFANWDGGHYLGIAKVGYSEKSQYAFFPLYPLAIRALNILVQNYLLSAVLLSLASTFFGLQILYKITKDIFDKKIAFKAVLLLLIFPTSFFLITAYSEGLFFLLTISGFYFLRQNKLFWATVFITLASATRLVGLAVVAGFLIDILIRQGLNRKNFLVLLSPLGFLLYCVFLYQQTGNPIYFITAENNWQRSLVLPGIGFWQAIRSGSLDLIFGIVGAGLAFRSFRFLPLSLAVYSLVSVAIPLFTPTLISIPRFLLVIFPIFILIALIKNRYITLTYLIFSGMLLSVMAIFFINGYWVS